MPTWRMESISGRPELLDPAAEWFHEKWGIPLAAYRESMEESLSGCAVPQWYAALEDGEIVGGVGVIENDFHDRKDLRPNVCAVYVEPEHRCRGLAGALLDRVCRDMKGIFMYGTGRRGTGTFADVCQGVVKERAQCGSMSMRPGRPACCLSAAVTRRGPVRWRAGSMPPP